MTWDEAEGAFVRADIYRGSATRPGLWHELCTHRALIECVFGSVSRIWLAGSFVSGKHDPGDIDLTYLIAPEAYGAVTEPDDLADLANLGDREWCVKHGMRIDAYILRLPATKEFQDLGVLGAMAPQDSEVFEALGLYDEIWQRHRDSPSRRRGYVEVAL
ncbi:hypothetical protein [Streptomyces sp. RFCAC02]|uniref:DUF6932 family protein n=1 Tax=Streptomyces sp. RFCAC02 TaxID=2499143 RepID=UPI0010223C19|nr:hypothetical protein [Streptomyces sp. RFCAC02]